MVMECGRSGCKYVLCDRYSKVFGYICNDCFEELVDMGPETPVLAFMGRPKTLTPADRRIAARALFNTVFTNMEGDDGI